MNEADRIGREEGILKQHLDQRLLLGICLAMCICFILFLSVWLLKDMITSEQLLLVPATAFSLMYVLFTAYSVYIFLTTTVEPKTKLDGKLLWIHGAGWACSMALGAVGGALVYVVKSLPN